MEDAARAGGEGEAETEAGAGRAGPGGKAGGDEGGLRGCRGSIGSIARNKARDRWEAVQACLGRRDDVRGATESGDRGLKTGSYTIHHARVKPSADTSTEFGSWMGRNQAIQILP